MTHPNEEVIRSYVSAFAAGDLETAKGHLADDIIYHVGGRHSLAGDYRGRDDVIAFFRQRAERTGRTFSIHPHDLLANDVHGVALAGVTATREERDYSWNVVTVYHLVDGMIAECWIIDSDQQQADEALA